MIVPCIKKLWGVERVFHNDQHYCMKLLILNNGAASSLHMHKVKRETFLVVKGRVAIEYGGRILIFNKGQALDIEPGEYHRFRAMSKVAWVVEASTMHDDVDVYRKEESKLGPFTWP